MYINFHAKMTTFENAIKNISCDVADNRSLTSSGDVDDDLQDIKRLIELTTQEGLKIRAVGNKHSWQNLYCVDGSNEMIVNTDGLNRILDFDAVNGVVHVQAGVQLRDLQFALQEKGWSLPLVAIPQGIVQTVVGCMSTASHGSGVSGTILSELVEEMTVVTGPTQLEYPNKPREGPEVFILQKDGTVRVYNTDVIIDDPRALLFRAFQVSLGMMGIIYSVKLRVVPRYFVQQATYYEQAFNVDFTKPFNGLYNFSPYVTAAIARNRGCDPTFVLQNQAPLQAKQWWLLNDAETFVTYDQAIQDPLFAQFEFFTRYFFPNPHAPLPQVQPVKGQTFGASAYQYAGYPVDKINIEGKPQDTFIIAQPDFFAQSLQVPEGGEKITERPSSCTDVQKRPNSKDQNQKIPSIHVRNREHQLRCDCDPCQFFDYEAAFVVDGDVVNQHIMEILTMAQTWLAPNIFPNQEQPAPVTANVLFRFVPKTESALLSPTYDGPKVYINHTLLQCSRAKAREFFQQLVRFYYRIGARPHWAKMHILDAQGARRLYGKRYDDFQLAHRVLDPRGLFTSSYLSEVFP